jgi:hypothetical protein
VARRWHPKLVQIRRYRKALNAAKLDEAHTFHQLYADYAPSAHEAELVAAAFAPETATEEVPR